MTRGVTFKLKGDKALERKLKKYVKSAPKVIDALLAKAAFHTHNVAVTSIQNSPATGEVYTRGNITHRASAPGEAPATDTGQLVQNITVKKEDIMHYTVGSRKDAPHGFWLEFGTSRMDARPWLTPAYQQGKKKLNEDIARLR